MSKIKLICGECIEAMKSIPKGSIDMILCDLPYGITRNDWDKRLPYEQMWEQYKRIIKEHGAIVLFGVPPFSSELILSNPKMFRYELIWEKGQGTDFLNANRKPLRAHENICVFYKKSPTYNPQKTEGKPYIRKDINRQSTNYGTFKTLPIRENRTGERHPTTVIKMSSGEKNVEKLHPTQKPVKLLEYLIKTYSNYGETVLDNCMGVGSTGVAAAITGRDFIGIEKDKHWFEIAQKRIRAAIEQDGAE